MVLHFTEFDTRELGSLAGLVNGLPSRTGVYWLTFDDGTEYIGQTVDFARRMGTHRRRQPGRIVRAAFAVVPLGDLDREERLFIAQRDEELKRLDSKTGLRNKLITVVPGGPGDGDFTVSPGVSIPLPWERSRRGQLPEDWSPAVDVTSSPRQHDQWRRLQQHGDWPAIRTFLRLYLRTAMSSPELTGGRLWTISALPNTTPLPGWRRLCTLNSGRVEAVYIGEDEEVGAVVHLNLALPESGERRALRELIAAPARQGLVVAQRINAYARPAYGVEVIGIELATTLLHRPVVADMAYRFTTRSQREGMTLQSRWHNQLFAQDLLMPDPPAPASRPARTASRRSARGPRCNHHTG